MKWVVGIDEVGRGPLAGPVHVGAVAMPLTAYKKMRWTKEGVRLGDSKKMTARGREVWEQEARRLVKANALRTAVASRTAAAIDVYGISACIRSCIARAIARLAISETDAVIFLDGGLRAPKRYGRQYTVVRGDQKHKIISLASVVAKVRRDTHMKKLHRLYPDYAWEVNKGYGTRAHTAALRKKGATPLHRISFITKVVG